MKDNKKIEAAKKLIELMQAYVNGKDIEKNINDKYMTITESDSIEFICIYNISKYRIKPKYKESKIVSICDKLVSFYEFFRFEIKANFYYALLSFYKLI